MAIFKTRLDGGVVPTSSIRRTGCRSLSLLPDDAHPAEEGRRVNKDTRVDDTQYDPPTAEPLATAASNEPVPTIADHYGHGWIAGLQTRFIPKRACEGAATIDDGDFRECGRCGVRVAHDMTEHPFFGFAACCLLKEKPLTESPENSDAVGEAIGPSRPSTRAPKSSSVSPALTPTPSGSLSEETTIKQIRQRLHSRLNPVPQTGRCQACGCEQEMPSPNLPLPSSLAISSWTCRQCGGQIVVTMTLSHDDAPSPDDDIEVLLRLLLTERRQHQETAEFLRDARYWGNQAEERATKAQADVERLTQERESDKHGYRLLAEYTEGLNAKLAAQATQIRTLVEQGYVRHKPGCAVLLCQFAYGETNRCQQPADSSDHDSTVWPDAHGFMAGNCTCELAALLVVGEGAMKV